MPPQLPAKRGSPGKGRNKWTYEQRVCLDILWHHPQSPSSSKRAQAFNAIFKDHLAACGVPDGLEYKVLVCQYKESGYKQKSTWAKTWSQVCAVPKQDSVLREQLSRRIERILIGGGATQASAGPATPPITPPQRNETIHHSSGTSAGKRPAVKPVRYRDDRPATPGPSIRKRPATVPDVPLVFDEDEEDESYEPGPKRAKRVHSPIVELPATPPQTIVTTPKTNLSKSGKTPKTKYRTGGRPSATHPFPRPNGSTLMLFEKEWLEAQKDLQIISEAAAHPKTGPSLVFRYWDDKSHGLNSPNGFVCGRYLGAILPTGRPPTTESLVPDDIGRHLNNAGSDQTGTPSPFISTSNFLIWTISMMLKKGEATGHISVIDTSKLPDERSMFYVPPFFKEYKKKRPFTRGGFQYQGSHEHLVWDRIPAEAVIKTFSLSDLIAFADSSDALKAVLRLEKLKTKSANQAKELKRGNIPISSRVAEAIAQIVLFLGLDHKSSLDTLITAVTEVAQGWRLQANGDSQEKADAFVQVFCQRSEKYVKPEEQLDLKEAFLSGLQWSCGDLNARLKGPEAYAKMQSNASKKGLIAPREIIIRELDALKLRVIMRERAQDRLHAAPVAIEGGETVDEVVDDGEVAGDDGQEEIVYDDDDDVFA